jgi:hypothetical protein
LRKWATLLLLLLLVSSASGIGYGVWLRVAGTTGAPMAANALAHLPDYVQSAKSDVQVAYQFAVDHPEVLAQIPCYCGCEAGLGHQHNLACYITAFNPDGSVGAYSDHAAY